MARINADYKIKALNLLLNKDCLPERYYFLVDNKDNLIKGIKEIGCKRKSDIEELCDEDLLKLGINNIGLFRRFLSLYDVKDNKFKELDKLDIDIKMKESFVELYYLPGVKQVRANLYYLAGYKKLDDFINTNEDEVIKKTSEMIKKYKLDCIVPLRKEIRTHIAVAKAFVQ